MVKLKAEEILFGIKVQDNKVLNYVYDEYFLNINSFVLNNSGSKSDAEDIFQEAIIIIFRKIKDEQLTLTCSFYTYLFSVCKKLWLKQLEKKQELIDITNLENEIIEQDNEVELFKKNEKFRLYQKHFKKLTKTCQEVLQLIIKNTPLIIVAKKTGFKNAKSVKRRKYKCKKQLIRIIRSDPEYQKFINDNE